MILFNEQQRRQPVSVKSQIIRIVGLLAMLSMVIAVYLSIDQSDNQRSLQAQAHISMPMNLQIKNQDLGDKMFQIADNMTVDEFKDFMMEQTNRPKSPYCKGAMELFFAERGSNGFKCSDSLHDKEGFLADLGVRDGMTIYVEFEHSKVRNDCWDRTMDTMDCCCCVSCPSTGQMKFKQKREKRVQMCTYHTINCALCYNATGETLAQAAQENCLNCACCSSGVKQASCAVQQLTCPHVTADLLTKKDYCKKCGCCAGVQKAVAEKYLEECGCINTMCVDLCGKHKESDRVQELKWKDDIDAGSASDTVGAQPGYGATDNGRRW